MLEVLDENVTNTGFYWQNKYIVIKIGNQIILKQRQLVTFLQYFKVELKSYIF